MVKMTELKPGHLGANKNPLNVSKSIKVESTAGIKKGNVLQMNKPLCMVEVVEVVNSSTLRVKNLAKKSGPRVSVEINLAAIVEIMGHMPAPYKWM